MKFRTLCWVALAILVLVAVGMFLFQLPNKYISFALLPVPILFVMAKEDWFFSFEKLLLTAGMWGGALLMEGCILYFIEGGRRMPSGLVRLDEMVGRMPISGLLIGIGILLLIATILGAIFVQTVLKKS